MILFSYMCFSLLTVQTICLWERWHLYRPCIMLSHVQRDEEDDVYEEVDEDEYSDIVRRRQEDNWIVDDGNVLRCEFCIIMVSCYTFANFHDSQK